MIVIRRLASCLICELVFNNEAAQAKLGELSDDFTPVGGAVSINMRFPTRLQMSHSYQLVQLFETLRDPQSIKRLTHSSGKYWSFPKY